MRKSLLIFYSELPKAKKKKIIITVKQTTKKNEV